MDQVQQVQSSEYDFPYHYIPQISSDLKSFSAMRRWDFSESYALALLIARNWIERHRLQNGSLLDVGCGDGGFMFALRRMFPNLVLVGVDYDRRAVEWARMFSPDTRFIDGDITASDFMKQVDPPSFDAASLIEVMEHIPPGELTGFIDAVALYLKPGGKLLVTVPHDNKPVEAKHYRHFTFDTLKAAIGSKFTCEKIQGFESRSMIKRGVKRLLQNNHLFVEAPFLARLSINYELKRIRPRQAGCGRIVAEFVKA